MVKRSLYEKLDRAQNALSMLEDSCRVIGQAGIAKPDVGEVWFEGVADTVQGVLDTVNDVFERYGDELEAEVVDDDGGPGFVPQMTHEEFMDTMSKDINRMAKEREKDKPTIQ
ncbi:MAG: hypothetical protein SWQ30_10080 [Thermodesulfobacteriota bacterium]|nr:hypothetical protein [Thermodesulfobacteriota bacterium]